MDTAQSTSVMGSRIVMALVQPILIVSSMAMLDLTWGQRFFILDDAFFMGVLFLLQWLTLKREPVLVLWLGTGIIIVISFMFLSSLLIEPVLVTPLLKTVFPTDPQSSSIVPREFFVVDRIIPSTILGLIVGISQSLQLRDTPYEGSWWIAMTTLAYAATSFGVIYVR